MKKVALLAAVFVFAAGLAQAANIADQNTGCGLGTILWEGKANDSSLFQAFQATTNGTSGNQTFGISSGTSGCKQPSSFVQNEKLIQFAAANLDRLAKDIAMGQGESLDTLAELMAVPAMERSDFGQQLQQNFALIFPTGKENYAQVLDTIYTITVNG